MVKTFVSTTTLALGTGFVLFLRWRASVRDRFVASRRASKTPGRAGEGEPLPATANGGWLDPAFSETHDDAHPRGE